MQCGVVYNNALLSSKVDELFSIIYAGRYSTTDLDGNKKNILKDWRLNPLTTSQRIELGNTLDKRHSGLPVYDTSLESLFIWTGVSWKAQEGGISNSVYGEVLQQSETPSVFLTSQAFIQQTTRVYMNGIRLKIGDDSDYIESGINEITFLRETTQEDQLIVDYDI